jgi:ADP-heptose:LPS heptosyltransferase
MQLPALIDQGILLIGNDAAPIHIATAVKTPVVALFGPTRWEDWQPRRSGDVTLFTSLACRPCGHSRPDCPLGGTTCMARIPVETVWKTLEVFFADSGIAPVDSLPV